MYHWILYKRVQLLVTPEHHMYICLYSFGNVARQLFGDTVPIKVTVYYKCYSSYCILAAVSMLRDFTGK
jgi:hypothetical protein